MTKETKHTPAPWHVDNRKWSKDKTPIIRDELGIDVAHLSVNQMQINANAILIAESPAMLGALKDLLNHHLHDSHGGDVSPELQNKLNKAHDSVARAEGKA